MKSKWLDEPAEFLVVHGFNISQRDYSEGLHETVLGYVVDHSTS